MHVLSHTCVSMCVCMVFTSVDFPEDGSSSRAIEKNCKLLIIFRKTVIKY